MKPQPDAEFAAFIGIDWADAKHDLCLQTADSEEREFVVLPHCADAIEAWARSLRQRFAGLPVALCLEIAVGGVAKRVNFGTGAGWPEAA